MNDSGRPREGWIAIIPLGAFMIFVVTDAGGPKQFVHTASYWLQDFVDYCSRLLQ